MASATNPLLSSNFFGTTTILHSPPTPKTTSKSKSSLPIPLPFFSQRKLFATKNIFNSKPDSQPFKSATSQATLAALLFSSLTPQPGLAIDNTPTPTPPPVLQAQPSKPNAASPFSQNLLLNAPKPQSQVATDLPEGSQWRYSEFLNAVKKGKVERVRFVKDGSALQLTAVRFDRLGRREWGPFFSCAASECEPWRQ
ncbi:hypothetical protein ACFX2I_015987 [Malus domestica]